MQSYANERVLVTGGAGFLGRHVVAELRRRGIEDVVVPRGRLEDLFKFAARLQKKIDLPIACFGHAGDGNIHVNVMVDYTQPPNRTRADAALDELFRQVVAWGDRKSTRLNSSH